MSEGGLLDAGGGTDIPVQILMAYFLQGSLRLFLPWQPRRSLWRARHIRYVDECEL